MVRGFIVFYLESSNTDEILVGAKNKNASVQPWDLLERNNRGLERWQINGSVDKRFWKSVTACCSEE